MVLHALILILLASVSQVWSGQTAQSCLKCHPSHYSEHGNCSDCHRGNPASERKSIAHDRLRSGSYAHFTVDNAAERENRQRLPDQLACRRCHVSAGRGNHLAANLDGAALKKTADELAQSIRHPVVNMPDFRLTEVQITTLVNALLAGSVNQKASGGSPVPVHFNISGTNRKDIFSRKCGSCHRMLSERLGAIGSGNIGPNLSGFLSRYYPKTFKNGDTWNMANLQKWLNNPRESKLMSDMQPVRLTEKERKELESLMSVSDH